MKIKLVTAAFGCFILSVVLMGILAALNSQWTIIMMLPAGLSVILIMGLEGGQTYL